MRVILGWDGLGFVSYLLVVYYQNYKSYGAGILTCLRNRIGDSALLVSIGWFLARGGLEFIFYYGDKRKELLVAAAFVVLAAMTKSAQVPFSAWLPAAIAAPTPVSALVHSSTLVTAGVYLLIRFFPIFSGGFINRLLLRLGIITMLISRFRAFYEMDLKKVIALSTLRQLGVIIVALGLKLHLLAFFHLLAHALFKASLFLSAGSIIHLYKGRQDIRNLRVVTQYIPATSSCLVVCSCALSGVPFLAAFYSKDKIIEEVVRRGAGFLVSSVLMVSIICTAVYSLRLIFYLSVPAYEINYGRVCDRRLIIKSIFLLTIGGIFGGRIIMWTLFSFRYDDIRKILKIFILFALTGGVTLGLKIFFNVPGEFNFYLRRLWVDSNWFANKRRWLGLNYGVPVYSYWDAGWRETLGPRKMSFEIGVLGASSAKTVMGFKIIIFLFLRIFVLIVVFMYQYSLSTKYGVEAAMKAIACW